MAIKKQLPAKPRYKETMLEDLVQIDGKLVRLHLYREVGPGVCKGDENLTYLAFEVMGSHNPPFIYQTFPNLESGNTALLRTKALLDIIHGL